MRPKFVTAVLVLACVLVAAMAMLSKALSPQVKPVVVALASPRPEDSGPPARIPRPVARKSLSRISEPVLAAFDATDDGEPEEDRQAQNGRHRIDKLNTLAKAGDAAARSALLEELQNQDKGSREAALKTIIRLGDRSMVPYLQEIAERTEDAAEKAEITKAIEYIQLPSLTERLAQQNAGAPTY